MSDGLTVHMDGLKELDDALTAIGDPKRVKRIIRKALRKGADIERAAMQERAPERPDLPSSTALPPGALKADIEVHATTDENGNLAVSIGPGKYTAHAARLVEYGHQMVVGGKRRVDKKGRVRGNGRLVSVNGTTLSQVPPHPWIRPAYEESREAAANAIVESIAADVTETGAI